MKLPAMKDMARSVEDEMSMGVPYALGGKISNYPCGLQITLCDPELEKLGLAEECEVGDLIHLFSMAEVTGVSKDDSGDGEKVRISLQIKFMSAEDEEEEDKEEDKDEPEKKTKGRRNLYFK